MVTLSFFFFYQLYVLRNCCNNGTLRSLIERERRRKESPLSKYLWPASDDESDDAKATRNCLFPLYTYFLLRKTIRTEYLQDEQDAFRRFMGNPTHSWTIYSQ